MGGSPMLTLDTIKADLEGRLHDVPTKHHLSVRWEPAPGIARVGVMIHEYTWEMRELVIDRLVAFENAHAADLAVEFDIFSLEDVNTVGFDKV